MKQCQRFVICGDAITPPLIPSQALFPSRRNRIAWLGSLYLFLTTPLSHLTPTRPEQSDSWMKDKFMTKPDMEASLPKLEAKAREICRQAAFYESAAPTIWVTVPHRRDGGRPIRCVISRVMCTLNVQCTERNRAQLHCMHTEHQCYIWCFCSLKKLPSVGHSQNELWETSIQANHQFF